MHNTKFNILIITFGKISSSKSRPLPGTESEIKRMTNFKKNSACNHTLLNRKKTKVPVTYGRNSMSYLASSNDVAINAVNGRTGNRKPGANVNVVPRWKLA